jgi:hypothetical protein
MTKKTIQTVNILPADWFKGQDNTTHQDPYQEE